MNAPVLLAQLAGSSAQTPASPKNMKVEKPQSGQAVTVHLDGNTKLDLAGIASEKLTFVRVGEKLIILFDNQSTVTVDPVFDSMGRPLTDLAFDMGADRTLSGEQFAQTFPITTDQSVLPAAGNSGPTAGANFSDPSVDALTGGTPLDLLGQEELPGINFGVQDTGVADTVPTAGENATIILNEDMIPGANGNAGGIGDEGTLYTASGVLAHNYQLNGTGTIDFAGMNGTTQVVNGVTVTFTWNAATNTLTGNDGVNDVFTLVLTDPVNGNFTITLQHALLHHAAGDNVEGSNAFTLTYTVHDADNDSVNGTVTLVINDDTPEASDSVPTTNGEGEGEGEGGGLVIAAPVNDEGATDNTGNSGNWGGNGDSSGNNATQGFLSFSPGADGLKDVTFATLNGQTADFQAIYTKGDGTAGQEAILYQWDAASHTLTGVGSESGDIVFTLHIDNVSTGHFTFQLDSALVHHDVGTTEENIAIKFPFTVTDGDGDQATANLTIEVNDDTPVAYDSVPTSTTPPGGDEEGEGPFMPLAVAAVVLDDEDQTGGNQDGPGDIGSGTTAYGKLSFDAGADGVKSVAFSPSVSIGGESVLRAIYVGADGVGISEAVTNLVWTPNANGGGTLQGFTENGHFDQASGSSVFTLTVDAQGNFSFELHASLDHPSQSSGEGSSDTAFEDNLSLSFGYTVTDGDGDQSSAHLTIAVNDDVPTVAFGASLTSVTLDETTGVQAGEAGSAGIPAAALAAFDLLVTGSDPHVPHDHGAISFGTSNGALVNANVSFGADGKALTNALVYSLTLATGTGESGLVDSGLKTTEGQSIYLFAQDGLIVGRVGGEEGPIALAIAIDPVTGQVSVAQYLSFQHSDITNANETVSLATGAVSVTVIATDGDGDVVTGSTDVSTQISFHDDAPTLTIAATNLVSNGLLMDGFTPNNNAWNTGSGTATGNAGGWTIANSSGGAGAIQLERVGDGYLGMHSSTGGYMVDLDASAGGVAISQALTLNEGQHYTLTFEAGSPAAGNKHLVVMFGGQVILELDNSQISGPMKTYTFDLVGGTGDHSNLLVFKDIGDADNYGSFIANVSVSNTIVVDETAGQQADSSETTATAIKNLFTSVTATGTDPNMSAQYSTGSSAAVTVAKDFGADGPATVNATVYSLTIGNAVSGLVTTEGKAIQLFLEPNGIVVGRYDSDNNGSYDKAAIAFTIDSQTGVVSVVQYVSLKHPDATSNDEGVSLATGALKATVTVTDGDGDKASASADISGTIRFEDDGPSLKGSSIKITVDEDDILTSHAHGTSPNDGNADGSYTNSPNDNSSGPARVSGTLAGVVDFGADGAAATGAYSFTSGATATLQALGLTSHGQALSYVVSNGVLTAFVDTGAKDGVLGNGEHPVFTLTVDPVTGVYSFSLHDSLDHVSGNGQNTALVSNNGVSQFDLGAVLQATDGDGDTIPLTGQLIVTIRDDVPSVSARLNGDFDITADETSGNQNNDVTGPLAVFIGVGNVGQDPDRAGAPLAFAQSSTAALNVTAVFGADGAATSNAIVYSLKLNGTDSGLSVTGGQSIKLSLEDGLIVGRVEGGPFNGQAAFAVAIDATTGKVSVVEYLSIKHPNTNDNDDSVSIASGKISAVVTITDGDGDKDSDSVDISAKIRFEDDGPTVNVTATGESTILLTTQDADTIGSATDTATSTANFGGVFSFTSSFGADGAGSIVKSFSLEITKAPTNGRVDSGLDSDGRSIYLYEINGAIVGSTSTSSNGVNSGNTIFKVSVDSDGKVTLTQYAEIDHATPGQTQGPYDGQYAVLGNGLISLTEKVTVTDGDGDKASSSASIDLGGNIRFADDGPTVTVTANGESTVLLTTQDADTIGSDTDTSVSTANFGGVFTVTSNYGADGAGSIAKTFVLSVTGQSQGGRVDSGLDSNGQSIYLYKVGDAIVGSTANSSGNISNGNTIFKVSVDGDGKVTLTQYSEIDHAAPGQAQGPYDGQYAILGNGLISLSETVTITDGDGDRASSSATIDLGGNIRFADDGPRIVGNAIRVTVDEDDILTGYAQGTSPNDGNADGSYTNSQNDNSPGPARVSGTLAGHVDFGADSAAATGAYTFTSGAATTLLALGLTSHGQALSYTVSNGVLTAFVNAGDKHAVFTLSVDPVTGAYTFSMFDSLDHVSGNDQNTTLVSTNGINQIDFGAVLQATDGDGDSVRLTGQLIVTVRDDVPSVDVDTRRESDVVLTTHDADTIGSNTDVSVSSANFGGVFSFTSSYGADGAGSVVKAFSLAITKTPVNGRVDSGLDSDGASIYLYKINGEIVGSTSASANGVGSNNTIFKVSVDGDGKVTLTQYAEIDHSGPGHSQGPYDGQYAVLNNGLVSLTQTVTVTDGDGDKASSSASIDLGGNIRFADDGPSVKVTATGESAVLLLTQDADTIGANNDTATSTANFGGAFSYTSSFGADGAGSISKTFALNVSQMQQGLVNSGLDSSGKSIYLYEVDGTIVGSTSTSSYGVNGSNTIFKLSVDSDGKVTLTQYAEIDHAAPGESQGPYDGQYAVLGNGLISLTERVTVTDGDGDKASSSATIDLGGNIRFADDGPQAAIAITGAKLVIDESAGLDAGTQDVAHGTGAQVLALFSAIAGTPIEVAQGSAAVVTAAGTAYGADGQGVAPVYTLQVSSAGVDSGLDATDGRSIFLFKEGNLIVGREGTAQGVADANGSVAFAISLNSATGVLTVAEYTAIHHPNPSDPNEAANPLSIVGNAIQATVTVTDGDGDTSVKSIGIGSQIQFRDDGPTVQPVGVNLAVNGNFQQGAWSDPQYWGSSAPQGTVPGWTLSGDPSDNPGTIQFERQAEGFHGLTSSNGLGMIDLGASPGNYQLSQTFDAPGHTLVASQQYVINFEAGAPFPQTALLEVYWGNTKIGVIDTTKANGALDKYSFIVTASANAGDNKLTFREVGEGNAPLGGTDQTEGYHGTYIANVSVVAVNAVVDEDGLPRGVGDSNQIGDAATNAASVTAALGINWGADNYDVADVGGVQDSVGRSLTFANANVAVGGTSALTSDGATVLFQLVDGGTRLVGYVEKGTANSGFGAGDRMVFEVRLSDDDTGSFQFILHGQIDHAAGGNENDITLAFNYTAKDSDGDTANGSFIVGVDDDMPVITAAAENGVINEGNLPSDQHPQPVGGFIGTAQPFTGQLNVNWGADNGDGRHLAFAKNHDGKVAGPAVTADGVPLVYFIVSPPDSAGNEQLVAVKQGHTADNVADWVFSVTLYDAGHGFYTFVQYQNIDHLNGGSAATVLGFTVNAFDADGDSVSTSFNVSITDSTPLAAIATNNVSVTIDESAGDQANDILGDANTPIPSALSGLGTPIEVAQSNGAVVSFTGTYGADGALAGTSPAFGLTVTDGAYSGVKATDGQKVFLYLVDGVVVGREGTGDTPNPSGVVVFAIAIDRGTGILTVAEYGALQHPDNTDPNESTTPLSLANGVVQATVSVTDGDNDTSTAATSITGQIKFLDDGPSVLAATDLIKNGSFEFGLDGLNQSQWGIYHSIADWTATRVVGGEIVPFEVQNGSFDGFGAQDGSAKVELDGDLTGANSQFGVQASGNHANHSNATNAIIQQTVTTVQDQTYVLTFWYSPRANEGDADSGSMNVLWNGAVVKSVDSTGMAPGVWYQISVVVTGTAAPGGDTLGFQGTGQENSLGAYIDNVSLLVRAAATVDEDGLPNGRHDIQPGDIAAGGGDSDNNEATATGQLGIKWGADDFNGGIDGHVGGDSAAGFVQDGAGRSVTFTNDTIAVTGGTLTSHGDVITLVLSADKTTLTGTATHGGVTRTVFEVSLSDDGTGAFRFILKDALDQATGSHENDITLSFNFTATDSDGDTANGSFVVLINDDVPVAVADTGAVNEGALLSVDAAHGVLANDSAGADGYAAGGGVVGVRAAGGNLTSSVIGGVDGAIAGQYGVLTLHADGSYTYKSTANGVSANATDTFVYSIRDADGDLSTTTLAINVTDSQLVATSSDGTKVYEKALDTTTTGSDIAHGTVTGSLPGDAGETATAGVSSTNGFGAKSYMLLNGSTPVTELVGTFGTIHLNSNGSYTYTLTSPVNGTSGDNGANTVAHAETFTYQVTDANGNTSTAQIHIDVVDDVPQARHDSDTTGIGNSATGNVITGDSTADAASGADTVGADGAHVTKVVGYNGATDSQPSSGNFEVAGRFGNLVIHEDGTYTYTRAANASDAGTDTFTYTLTDGDGDTTTATLTINLEPQNLLVVGSNVNDVSGEATVHTVPGTASNHGVVSGEGAQDVLVGDSGGASAAIAGKVANFVFVIDASGSVDDNLALMKTSVNNLLNQLGGSGAQDVRIHIVSFNDEATDRGTFDIIQGGAINQSALTQAFAAVNGIQDAGDGTNYEAGMQAAQLWIQGGTTSIAVDKQMSSFDANAGIGNGNNDTAYIIGHDNTQIALVSGWMAPGTTIGTLDSVQGNLSSGWSVGNNLTRDELLRFDFGALNDFDGAGSYPNGTTFNGAPVLTASFTLNDNSSFFNSTSFAYTIHFVGGGTQGGSASVFGSSNVTLAGSGGNLGKLIDYIEFSVTNSSGAGAVDLQSITTPVTAGTLPNATVNQLVFISDGQPNEAFNESGNVISTSAQSSIDHITGTGSDTTNEVGAIRTDGDGAGPDLAFTIQAFGLGAGTSALNILGQVEGPGGSAVNLANGNTLTAQYTGVVSGLAGMPATVLAAGNDAITGKDGGDIIFGDVLFTDTLAAAKGINLPAGSGWAVFALLETGTVAGWTSWTRADTLAYIRSHQAELAAESGRSGGNDTIDGGAGDDVIYGQEGNDVITGGLGNDEIHGGSGNDTIYYNVGDGNDIVDGGAGSDTLHITNTGGAQVFNIGTITGGAEILPVTGTNATDILVSYNGGASTIRMDEIEDIVLHLGSGGDTVNLNTSLNGTSLDVSTINIFGGAGNDVVDLTGRGNDIHRVVADGGANGNGGDTVKLDFAYSAVTSVVAIAGGFEITHNGITDVFTNFENFQFTDVTQTYAQLVAGPAAPSIGTVTDDVPQLVGPVDAGGVTNDPTLAVKILLGADALAGNKLQLFDGANAIGSAVILTASDIATGYVTITTPALAQGSHQLNAKLSDVFSGTGTASSSFGVTVDTTVSAPGATLAQDTGSSGSDRITSNGQVNVTLASDVASWEYSVNGGSTWVAGTGTGPGASFTLPEGTYGNNAVQVRQIDLAGNVSTTTNLAAVTIDTTADVGNNLAVVINDGDGYINNAERTSVSYTLSGLDSDASASVTFTSSGGGSPITVNGLTGNGTRSVNLNGLPDGIITVTVKATDVAANTANGTGDTSTKDTVADATPGLKVTFTDGDGYINNAEKTAVGYTLTGLDSDATATVTFKSNNGSATIVVSGIQANGAQSPVDLSSLGDGTITMSVSVTDVAGNTAFGTSDTSVKDTVAPNSGTLTFTSFDDTGSVNSPPVTTDNNFGLSLSGQGSGSTVYQRSTDGGSTWVTLGNTAQNNLADGNYLYRAVTADAAGNQGVTAEREVIIDRTAPTIGISTTIGTDSGVNSSILSSGLTKDNTLALSGTVSDANGVSSVQIYDGGTLLGSAVVTAGTWSYTTSALSNGNHSFIARAVDNAGNTTTSSAITATVDAAAPTVTISNTIGTDTGATTSITSNGSTKDKTLALSGTVSDNNGLSSVQIYDGSTLLGSAIVSGGTWSFTTAALDEGSHSFSAKATDLAGNMSTSSNVIAKIDTTSPTVSSEAITGATGIQNSTLNAGDIVSVTVTMSEVVTVTGTPQLSLNIGGTMVLANYSSGSGSSSLVFTYTIQNGQTDTDGISVNLDALSLGNGTIKDAVGNPAVLNYVAVGDNAGYKVDTNAPTVGVATIASDDVINGAEASAGVRVSGTNEAGATVTLNGATVVVDTATTWHYDLSTAAINGYGQGAETLVVIATDAAGNTTTVNKSISVDTAAPTVTITTDDGTLTAGDVAHLTFTLSEASSNFEAGDVAVAGGTLTNFVKINDTKYTADFTPTANSTTNATINVVADKFTDAAGNANTAAVQLVMTVDTTAAHAPSGANKTIGVVEDVSYTFTAADFGFQDSDGDGFAGVIISSLPGSAAGKLMLGNAAVSASQFVTAADIAAGMLTYAPTDNVYDSNPSTHPGDTSFTFQVRDDSGGSAATTTDQSPDTITIDMSSVNYQDDTNYEWLSNNSETATYNLTSSGTGVRASITDQYGTSDRLAIDTSSSTAFTDLVFARSDNNLEISWAVGQSGRSVTVLDQFQSGNDRFELFSFDSGGSYEGFSLGSGDYTLVNGLSGTGGSDIIAGSSASETLTGGGGKDLLFGNGGNDILNGGAGNDLLVGGMGADTFKFTDSGSSNRDIIADYSYAEGDVIDLSSLLSGLSNQTGRVRFEDVNGQTRLASASGNSNLADGDLTIQVNLSGSAWTDVAVIHDTGTNLTAGNDVIKMMLNSSQINVTV